MPLIVFGQFGDFAFRFDGQLLSTNRQSGHGGRHDFRRYRAPDSSNYRAIEVHVESVKSFHVPETPFTSA